MQDTVLRARDTSLYKMDEPWPLCHNGSPENTESVLNRPCVFPLLVLAQMLQKSY